jgi:aldose 1-epimerase
MPDGAPVSLYILRNGAGMTVEVIDYGAIITRILAPARDGSFADVVLGFDSLPPYLARHPYFGALVGRYANRIAGGRFELDGQLIELDINEPPNHLHGGTRGFDRFLWTAAVEDDALLLARRSPAGEQGYPANLDAQVRYRLDESNTLSMLCTASSDGATPVNLTQHSYFNLAGGGDILGHELQIAADGFTPIDAASIPLGGIVSVAGGPFDFRVSRAVGSRIDEDDRQLHCGRGYDHNFVLSSPFVGQAAASAGTAPAANTNPADSENPPGHRDAAAVADQASHLDQRGETTPPSLLRSHAPTGPPAARLHDPASGRTMELWTDQPGLQCYSGNLLDGSQSGKGRRYIRRSGLCLEPQHFPNSPNVPAFPSTILRPGQIYRHATWYRFSVE